MRKKKKDEKVSSLERNRNHIMATGKYMMLDRHCSSMNKELSRIIKRVIALRKKYKKKYNLESDTLRMSEQQLVELTAYIGRKRQLLVKDCPLGTKHWWDANTSLFRMLP